MKRGRECSHIVIQQKENYAVLSPHASVCARKREDGFTEYKGRGATLFLPSSYFLYHSSICRGGVEGWVWGVKRGRKGNNILTLQHMLLLPHTQIWVLMDSYKLFFFPHKSTAWATVNVKCHCQARLSPWGWQWHQHPRSCQLDCICTCGIMTELSMAENVLLDRLLSSPPNKPFFKRRCLSDVSIFHLLELSLLFLLSCLTLKFAREHKYKYSMCGVVEKEVMKLC